MEPGTGLLSTIPDHHTPGAACWAEDSLPGETLRIKSTHRGHYKREESGQSATVSAAVTSLLAGVQSPFGLKLMRSVSAHAPAPLLTSLNMPEWALCPLAPAFQRTSALE